MTYKIWIVTLFPEYFESLQTAGVVSKAFRSKRPISLNTINPRDYAFNHYKSVDDYPFGGGAGMIMRADVLARTLREGIFAASNKSQADFDIILTSPRGRIWNDQAAQALSQKWQARARETILICGRYEGIDERFIQKFVTSEISLGDYILSGGEIAALAIIDSAIRKIPGILGAERGALEESFVAGKLEAPVYTRPREFEGMQVPAVYLSGHHQRIQEFNARESLRLTGQLRPDLLGIVND